MLRHPLLVAAKAHHRLGHEFPLVPLKRIAQGLAVFADARDVI